MKNGHAVLLHLERKAYYSLNETGAYIWRNLSMGQTLLEVSRGLELEFDVTTDIAKQSVSNLVDELAAEDLLKLSTE